MMFLIIRLIDSHHPLNTVLKLPARRPEHAKHPYEVRTYSCQLRIFFLSNIVSCSALFAVLDNNLEIVITNLQKCLQEYMSESFGSDATAKDYISGLLVFNIIADVFYEYVLFPSYNYRGNIIYSQDI